MKNSDVLISVIKRQKDLELVLQENWYRIPENSLPIRTPKWIALYQTSDFKKHGKCIRYYAKIISSKKVQRSRLLADETDHPRAGNTYIQFSLGPIQRLKRIITNKTAMKIVFAYTTFDKLLHSRFLHTLLETRPSEPVLGRMLKKAGITAQPEYPVRSEKGTYRLDYALLCRNGGIDIECDSPASHSTPEQKQRDRIRDIYLQNKGWTVLRFRADEIFTDKKGVLNRIEETVRCLGGLKP